jgi:heme exporter protein D
LGRQSKRHRPVNQSRRGGVEYVVDLRVWLAFFFMFVVVVALAAMFVVHARAIRRDMNDRFARLQKELEEEAQSLVRDMVDEDNRT